MVKAGPVKAGLVKEIKEETEIKIEPGTSKRQRRPAAAARAMKGGQLTLAQALKSKSDRVAGKVKKGKRSKKSMIVRQSDYVRKGWAYRLIWSGSKNKTPAGITKGDLMPNKSGKIVSKRKHAGGVKLYVRTLKPWIDAFMEVRKEQCIVGFVAIKKLQNGATPKQALLYKHTLERWFMRVQKSTSSPGHLLQP